MGEHGKSWESPFLQMMARNQELEVMLMAPKHDTGYILESEYYGISVMGHARLEGCSEDS